MQRRSFIKNTLLTSTGWLVWPQGLQAAGVTGYNTQDTFDSLFKTPPDAARPWVFWQWMNGHITKEGITADLEAMKRMGIGGAICFNNAVGIPRGPVDYASEAWMQATVHAAKEAARLGLVLTLHNSPGYSGCGGPWITPDKSMQQLVWTETRITSTGSVSIQLPQPYAKHEYYKDACVIAYPSLPVETMLMKDVLQKVTLNGKEIDKNILTDGSPTTCIRLEVENKEAILLFECSQPFEARAITILRKPETPRDLFDGPRDHPPLFRLESSNDGTHFTTIGIIRNPELREMDTPTAWSFPPVKASQYRLVATTSSWVCNVELHNGPRLAGWPGKTSNTHGDSGGDTPPIEKELLIDPATVMDISDKMDSKGLLKWSAPAGNYTILRIGHTTTGEEPAAHPDAGKGLEVDKFSKQALELHVDAFLDKLLTRLKPVIGKGFKGITVDSWEAGKQNWTPGFETAFLQYTQYCITPWLPALTGRVVGSVEETERFLWDVRKTQAHLLAENFYGHFSKLCHDRGLEFYAEPYGDGNFDSLEVSEHLDITMSEFWTRYIYGSDVTSKQAASAAHVYGKKIVAAESYTAMPATSKWTDYPYSLKAEGDYFYTLGINRLTFHVFVHQPYMTGKPGMTMGPFGMHIDRNNTWTEQAHAWTKVLQRTQYVLQQGLTVADICYFKGDDPESGIPDIYRQLPAGYAGDVIGADALHKRFSITNDWIVLPDGMSYRICIMAPLQSIQLSTINRIRELVAAGMVLVVSTKPSRSYGLNQKDEAVQQIVDELYGPLDGITVSQHAYGAGKIIWNSNWQEVVQQLNLEPDFTYTAQNQDAAIHYIHKTIGDTAIYYISNHRRRWENIVVSLRTTGWQPELADPMTGEIKELVLYREEDNRTLIPFNMEPAGALFIVLRKKATRPPFHTIVKDGIVRTTVHPFPAIKSDIHAAIQNNFSITCWIKPDTFAHGGRSMLFHPPEGEKVYGSGHSAIGISAGRNVLRVYERTAGPAREVLTFNGPLPGWTYVALVCQHGMLTLYINGKQVAAAKTAGKVIHPGTGTPAKPDQFASYFEGNQSGMKLIPQILTASFIRNEYLAGLPAPSLSADLEVSYTKEGMLRTLAWEDGQYSIENGMFKKIAIAVSGCRTQTIGGDWTVHFPNGSGAPAALSLPVLQSLHTHPDFNVRHFAGTCVYHTILMLEGNRLQDDKRFFLHLGRVEVIAEVKVNGINVGILWKEPYLVEITTALKDNSSNLVEIAVTNLWPNRLIGDEQLPQENEYSEHGFVQALPQWYTSSQPKPGPRKSFSVWHTYDKDDPLFESGLLGPVQLITAIEKNIPLS